MILFIDGCVVVKREKYYLSVTFKYSGFLITTRPREHTV